MSDHLFRLIFGAVLIIAIYFKQQNIIMALVAMLIFEGLTARDTLLKLHPR